MERKINFSVGEFYHIYNRGVEKRNIFIDNNDKERFVRLLFVANGTKPFVFRDIENKTYADIDRGNQIVAIGSYCLMPNHFHILVKEIVDNGISIFMEKLTTGYSMYFNRRNKRVGPLFQSRFKAQHAQRDDHLKYLFAYIHLNPIKLIEPNWKETGILNKSKAKSYLNSYRHSSYSEYIGMRRPENLIITREEFPEYFSNVHEFEEFVEDWISFSAEPLANT